MSPKFQTAYCDIEDRKRRITLDIEKINSAITLTTEDCVCIIAGIEYANAILIRLFLRPLILTRQEGFQSAKIIFIDDKGRNNNRDSIVRNFTLKYGPSKKCIE